MDFDTFNDRRPTASAISDLVSLQAPRNSQLAQPLRRCAGPLSNIVLQTKSSILDNTRSRVEVTSEHARLASTLSRIREMGEMT
jgi:hypothetical protein